MVIARSWLLCLPMIVACSETPGPTTPTSELGIQAFAIAGSSNDLELEVTFTTDGADGIAFAALDDDDEIVAQLGDARITLRAEVDSAADLVRYTGSFVDLGDRRLVINLRRARDIDTRSTVTVPSPFLVLDPPAEHGRGTELVVGWDVTGEVGTTRVLLAGDCVAGSEVRIDADPGTATIPAVAFDAPTGVDPTLGCSASIGVDRLADGQADLLFGRGGRVEAAQTRSFPILIL